MRTKWFTNLLEEFAILITKNTRSFFGRLKKSRFLFSGAYFISGHPKLAMKNLQHDN